MDFGRTVAVIDGVTVLYVKGEVEMRSAEEFRAALAGVLDSGATNVVVDLAEVTFFDSTGIHVLEEALISVADRNVSFALSGLSARLRRLFMITDMFSRVNVQPTVEDAVAAKDG